MDTTEIKLTLLAALTSPHGVEVETTDTDLFKRRFYKERKDHPEFTSLSCRTHPSDPNKLWLVKNAQEED